MPNKPEKWRLKIWCLANSVSRFVSNFDVYCGASIETIGAPKSKKGEPKMEQRVVEALLVGLEGRKHVVVMDNFFTSVELFCDLEWRGTYATGTLRRNRIGLLDFVKDQKTFKKSAQGSLEWAIHDSWKMCAVM